MGGSSSHNMAERVVVNATAKHTATVSTADLHSHGQMLFTDWFLIFMCSCLILRPPNCGFLRQDVAHAT